MKSLWTGAIGFGLVNIPVQLFSATLEPSLDLDMLDKKDHARIRFKRVNENTGKEVPWESIVKGYDYNGKYVVLTDEDFAKASPEKSKLIQISQFVKETEVESIFFETPYLLKPQKSGERAYVLLREALKKTARAALGTFVLRNREHLCILKPMAEAIVLIKIRFAEEIRDFAALNLPKTSGLKPNELKLAISLVHQLSGSFDIKKYKDNYSGQLMKMIRAKAKGKKLQPVALRVVHNKTKDLMSQLKASIENKKKKAS
jgi:DNA end-binding protein Ku